MEEDTYYTYVVLRTGRRPKIGDGTRLCDENEEESNRQFAHILGIRIYEKKIIPQQHIEKPSYDGLNLFYILYLPLCYRAKRTICSNSIINAR